MKKKLVFISIFSVFLFIPKILWADCTLPPQILLVLQGFDKGITKNNIEFQCNTDVNITQKSVDEIITITKSDDLKSKFVSIPTRTDFTLYYSTKLKERHLIELLLIKQNNLYEGDTITKHTYDFIYSSKSLTGASVRSSLINDNPMATSYFWLLAKTQKPSKHYIVQKLNVKVHPRGSLEMAIN